MGFGWAAAIAATATVGGFTTAPVLEPAVTSVAGRTVEVRCATSIEAWNDVKAQNGATDTSSSFVWGLYIARTTRSTFTRTAAGCYAPKRKA
jgi:hypothetical protein